MSLIRLAGAVLAEQYDEWAEGQRYLGLDVLARSRMTMVTAESNEDNTIGEEVTASTPTAFDSVTGRITQCLSSHITGLGLTLSAILLSQH